MKHGGVALAVVDPTLGLLFFTTRNGDGSGAFTVLDLDVVAHDLIASVVNVVGVEGIHSLAKTEQIGQ